MAQVGPGHVSFRHFWVRKDGTSDDEVSFGFFGELRGWAHDLRGVDDVEKGISAVRVILMSRSPRVTHVASQRLACRVKTGSMNIGAMTITWKNMWKLLKTPEREVSW